MKGIVLSGGRGTRLYPATKAVSKQLIPLYDKPMVYYPLATLMQMGIREILVVTTPEDEERYRHLLSDGTRWGINISYCRQPKPEGIAQALLLGQDFIKDSAVALILGDNFIHGEGLFQSLARARAFSTGAINFAYRVSDPQRYGIIEFDAEGRPQRLVEKPAKPKSNWAVIGLYVYDQRASDYAADLKPSARGELEITDLNQRYLDLGQLRVEKLGPGNAWLDTGTHDSWLEACHYVQTIFHRQGQMIGCPEEVAYRNNFISAAQLDKLAHEMRASTYGQYLKALLA
ncbi:glucose-1-phosphate thymidylyltransferase RfbA [Dongia deserti]|uniref:glucose-1-phosphate thymidylyltransferase RfbA n=1 Tax=Dongia deserti TaxID=2268030 RepID=UPI000E65C97C|nr:glucose-1-phosphate thymidylyltransferase RfbA [Dongia deserti]